MGLPAILRLIHKKVESGGILKTRSGLLGDEYNIETYRITDYRLILQVPDQIEVFALPQGSLLQMSEGLWKTYCRWHSGPLDMPDNPLERIYCNIPAEDYCNQHRRSPRAYYDRCVTLRGEKGLYYCSVLDRQMRGEYIVYLTDFGGDKPKVGITRKFRAIERIAEQPHITATILAVTDSAVKARRLEMEISASGLAQEIHRKEMFRHRSIGESASRLSFWAERIAHKLGLDWEGKLLAVLPPEYASQHVFTRRPEAVKERFRVTGFWGGYLYLETVDERKIAVNHRQLQHRDSLLIITQGAGQG
jgi:hypothetical protein